jgi:hypothetical protein
VDWKSANDSERPKVPISADAVVWRRAVVCTGSPNTKLTFETTWPTSGSPV